MVDFENDFGQTTKEICCGLILKPPHRGNSIDDPKHVFLKRFNKSYTES